MSEPPTVFIGQAPVSAITRPGAQPMPSTMGIERITRADRRACRHHLEKETLDG
jgi:hypothetical protein